MRSTSVLLAAIAALLSSAACIPSVAIKQSTLQRATAGVIGCPSSEIAISGQPERVQAGQGPVEWRAECRGRRYVCSGMGDVLNCSEELPAAK